MPAAMVALSMFACTEGPQFSASRSFTSTVAVSRETALELRTVLPTTAVGSLRLDEVRVKIDATVTASTSTRAKKLADALALGNDDDPKDAHLGLFLEAPSDATLSGTMAVEAPADMALTIVNRGGTTDVSGFTGDITVGSVSHARVVGAMRSLTMEVVTGNGLVDSNVSAGTTTSIKVTQGDIELAVPAALSADIQAITGQGQIYPAHPSLPPFFGRAGEPYATNVGGGLAIIRLQTGAGNIVIRAR